MSCAIGRSICFFIVLSVVWPLACVSQLRNGTYSVVTSTNRAPDFDEPPGEQAAAAEAARVVLLVALLRLQRDVERGPLFGAEQAMGVVERPQQRLLLIVARELSLRASRRRAFRSSWWRLAKRLALHALGRPDRLRRLFGIRQVHRPELAAEEAGGGEGLQLLLLADPFQPLADVDERRE